MKIAIKPNKIELNFQATKVYPELEDLEITPSSFEQNFKSSKYGYDNVKVKAIETTELNIMPSTENQVKEGTFSKVTVAGDSNLVEENIKEGVEIFGVNGTYVGKETEYNAIVYENPPKNQKIANTIIKIPTIDFNGHNNISSYFENCTRLEKITMKNTASITHINSTFASCYKITKITFPEIPHIQQMNFAFSNCSSLTEIENINTDNCNFFSSTFASCSNLTTIPEINTSSGVNFGSMFYGCNKLTTIHKLNLGKAIRVDYIFYNCKNLTNLGGLEDVGKSFTEKRKNYSLYKIDLSACTLLTHESLMNVINNLYDLNLTYDVANGGTLYRQTLSLGSTNLAKLTAEEIAIATNKGWDVT